MGLLANYAVPQEMFSSEILAVGLGLTLILISGLISALSLKEMRRAGTSPDPLRPPTKLVLDGAFRYSRNPIYLSFTIIYVGITIALNALWPLPLLIIALIVVDRAVISKEEKILERRFGEEYARYKAGVRRWI